MIWRVTIDQQSSIAHASQRYGPYTAPAGMSLAHAVTSSLERAGLLAVDSGSYQITAVVVDGQELDKSRPVDMAHLRAMRVGPGTEIDM